jgi:hypothetical protein
MPIDLFFRKKNAFLQNIFAEFPPNRLEKSGFNPENEKARQMKQEFLPRLNIPLSWQA